jgi:HK97 family phage major capsid protein
MPEMSTEQYNALATLVLGKLTKAMEARDRAGAPGTGKDVRDDPNLKKWMEGLKSGFGPETTENPDAPVFKGLVHQLRKGKEMADFTKFSQKQSAPIPVGSFFKGRNRMKGLDFMSKAAGIVDNGALQQVFSQDLEQEIYQLPVRPIRIRDTMMVLPTKKDIKTFAQQTGFVNGSGVVPLIPYDPALAQAYPLSSITITEMQVAAKLIATYIASPKKLFDDIEETAPVLENQLTNGVYDIEDAELLYGPGTGNHCLGLMNQPNIQMLNWSDGDHLDNQADAILNMIVKLWVALYQPDTIVMAPIDLARIWKMKDGQQRYQFPVAHENIDYSDIRKVFYLWGLPVVQTNAQVPTKVSVGALKSACVLWDREEANVWLSREHLDWAVKGLVAVVAEEQIILQVNRPESLGLLTLNNAPA